MQAYFRLRLITAQRGCEVAAMKWSHVDLAKKWWTIPSEIAKNGKTHRVPLSTLAASQGRPRYADRPTGTLAR